MVTRTIYTDASMVVINIGKSALPWLQETTYLLDPANGKTTRTQAQTVMPTPGVTESNIVYPATSIINGSLIYTVITEATGVVTSIIGTTTYPYVSELTSRKNIGNFLSKFSARRSNKLGGQPSIVKSYSHFGVFNFRPSNDNYDSFTGR